MKRKRWTVLAVFAMVVALLPLSAVPAAADPTVLINEVDADQESTDSAEFVELYDGGVGNTSLNGYSIVLYNGSDDASYLAFDLDGESTDSDGYFVLCGDSASVTNCDLDVSPNTNLIQNGADAVALVVGNAVDYPNDTPVSTSNLIDAIVYDTDDSDDAGLLILLNAGQPQVNERGGGDGTAHSNQRCPNGDGGARNTDTYSQAIPTPGDANECSAPPEPTSYKIHEIQGSGMASPMVGAYVAIEGVMVGDFRTPHGLGGFFVQEEDVDADADPATSEGIFVYDPVGTVGVVGDTVGVVGTVSEFQELTEIGADSVVVGSAATASAAKVLLPVGSLDEWEQYEGMLVTFPQDLYITEFYNFDRYGEIVLATERQYQPTSLFEPWSSDAFELRDAIPLHRITLDDGRSDENPDPARHPNGAPFTLDNRFRGGDIVADVTGVMDGAFGKYKIQPTAEADYKKANPRPLSPPDVDGTVKVASFNVLNFFTHIDDRVNKCGPLLDKYQCRGADTDEELQRQLTKIVAGIRGTGADIVGLQEIENDISGAEVDGNRAHDPVLTLVEALNAKDGEGAWAWVGVADYYNTYPVRNEIIYRTATVEPVGAPVALDDPAFDTVNPGRFTPYYPLGRPPLAQTFSEKASKEVFTVVTNHFKSKGSSCATHEYDGVLDGYDLFQANCNLTRVAQAEALLDFVEDLEAVDPDVLVIGDLNSYAIEDPIEVLEDGGFTDLHQAFEGSHAYSYVFDGQLGYLDHALANPSMLLQVTGAATWHINADEPDILDYDMSFKKDPQDALYEPNAFRASDHDPVIVGLNLAPVELTATPNTLWPLNHKYVMVTVSAVVGGIAVPVEVLSVASSEDDSGYNKGDKPDDVGAIDGDSVMLRAERFTPEGRVYTITVSAFGGAWTGTVDVVVPHDMGRRHNIK